MDVTPLLYDPVRQIPCAGGEEAAPPAQQTRGPVDLSDVVVCSFYTADSYYRAHAEQLRKNLDRIGIAYELEEIEKADDEEWPDICRKKIGFLARVCDSNPDKNVFWIDVDCILLELPKYIAEFTADIIGFQRGFGSPLRIGYLNRTRFWEPCFFGINTTPSARKFIRDASLLEQNSDIRATDDYFFEESWRSNAARLSFQVIPSIAVLAKATGDAPGVPVFFSFGASGNVERFKDSVRQHDHVDHGSRMPLIRRARFSALRTAKLVERKLPNGIARPLRQLADASGVTHVLTGAGTIDVLTGGRLDVGRLSPNSRSSPHRNRIVKEMVVAGQRGDGTRVDESFGRLVASGVPSEAEIAAKRAADAFAAYASREADQPPVRLVWWPRPFPGNFGDWLSPLVLSSRTGRAMSFQAPTVPTHDPHIFAVGSIGRFIKSSSIVVGTGISNSDLDLDGRARFISVRGPLTADALRLRGGPRVDTFGDPGLLISRIIPLERGLTNGRIALVRHFKHASLPLLLADKMDELSVLRSHPGEIRSFVAELNQYDAVITSAMHVMILCHSYGIPCALITFHGFESLVHGDGMKYQDYCLGAGLTATYDPVPICTDLRRLPVESIVSKERVSEGKLDEIEQSIDSAIELYNSMTG